MAKEGSKKVPIAGVDDKRQVTAVFWGYLSSTLVDIPEYISKMFARNKVSRRVGHYAYRESLVK